MQNSALWQPSKYVLRKGKLRASSVESDLNASSRLIADLVAAEYDRAIKEYVQGRLLDLGCGKVPLYGSYRDFVSDVQCVDWSESFHASSHLDKVCDLSERLDYPDSSFDTIILSDVLEHLSEPGNCWKEMNRLLAPDGKVILNVPFYYWIHEEPYDFYRYTEFCLARFAKNFGFKIILLKPIGGALDVFADLTAQILVGAKLRLVAIWLQALALGFGKTGIGNRLRKRTWRRFPLGYFMVVEKIA